MNTYIKEINNDAAKMPYFWHLIISLALLAGLILSILSWLELCVEHCSANQNYLLFGLPFAFGGMTFFVTAFAVHIFSRKYSFLSTLLSWMIAAAFGSEIMFIAVQKYEIGHWCPVCLGIALTVLIVGFLLIATYFKQLKTTFKSDNRGQIMDVLKKGLTTLSFAFVGFLMAFIGVSKPNLAEAAINDMKEKLAFGNRNSPIEVYFVTDWFCPSCRKVEPLIEKIFPAIQSRAAFYFIDYPIHKKSLNFTPYNLAFMINDRQHYFKARDALTVLAEENDSPNDQDVASLAQKNRLNFRELSFVEVKGGMEFFDKIVEKYNLNATPVLIFTNVKNNKVVKLEGRDEITESRVMKALESVSPEK